MAYSIRTYNQINLITQEIRNRTGLTVKDDSDAGIRADGTASVVEGLYHHQIYIQRQLFIATADEPFLYIHAEELGLPRSGGDQASGTGLAKSNIDLVIPAGSKLTNGRSYYWTVVSDVELQANIPKSIDVIADQVGASWNASGSLTWVSPQAGLEGNITEVSIGGGTDGEELEDWRTRLSERKQLGISRDRKADLIKLLEDIEGVQDVYPYPKRRGLGTFDVAITAVGNPPTLPSQALIETAQAALDEYAGFWVGGEWKVYSPSEQLVSVTAVITGNANLVDVRNVIKDYFAELAPGKPYLAAILSSRIVALAGVTDLALTPSQNITPSVDWMHTRWLRLGLLTVSAA
ncbi:baseplate J/gp47 family protein [Acinetobacter vivianii]